MSSPKPPAAEGGEHLSGPGRLVGRSAELALLDGFFGSAAVRGRALMLTGEAGVGKSALLDAAARRAEDKAFQVLRVTGSQVEAGVGFAALDQILRPLTTEIAELAPWQARTLRAVRAVGGLPDGRQAELLAVAGSVQVLLSRKAARGGPVAIVIDDVAWLDRPSAVVLGTVARCTHGAPVALLAACRTGDESFLSGTGIPAHEVRPLDETAAHDLVAGRFPAMAPRVRQRLVAEAAGNPLALLELPATLDEAQRQERGPLPAVLPLPERLKKVFAVRVEALPKRTRELLLLAVLDGSGGLHILERALGGGDVLAELGPAEQAGLVRVDTATGRLAFRHPLTRSAVMELSTAAARRRGHLALAREFPAGSEIRARHLADAAVGPDDEVAALLHEVAYRTLRRGDAVGAVSTLLRAADLSGTGTARGRLLAEAACLGANVTGDLRNVHALLGSARLADPVGSGSLAAATAAASRLVNGEGDVDTAHRLLTGAIRDHAAGPRETGTIRDHAAGPRETGTIRDHAAGPRETGTIRDHAAGPRGAGVDILDEALLTLLVMCFHSGRPELWKVFDAEAAKAQVRSPDDLLCVLRSAFGDPAHAAPAVLELLDGLVAKLHRETDPRRIVRTAVAAAYVDRLPGCRSALRRVVDDGRDGGAITMAIEAFFLLANDAYLSGQWGDLPNLTDEGLRWCARYDYRLTAQPGRFLRGLLAAAQGDTATARRTADRLVAWGNPRGLGLLRVYAAHIRALSALGEADFESAYRHLRSVITPGEIPAHLPHALWLFLDFAEAAARTGRHGEAAAHVAAVRGAGIPAVSPRLAMMTDAAEAVAAPDAVDHELFRRAVDTPDAERWPFEWARIRLAYGERLRRARAGAEARGHLDAALGTFRRLGAGPWSARAANELRASGIPVGVPVGTAAYEAGRPAPLTPQELQVARLAATGLTNKQIAARLFLSPRTVAGHLSNAFPKLNVTSRAGLRDALTGLAPERTA
ncbi:AAA family ATPase [Streptomyces sp. NPDC001601]|uniref:helix-turn-helix transcriptional regulator n=1 Tax=Streptomyces sp. NPDC001601 TaxID=3364592 RepID=UPI00368D92E6